MKEISSLDNTEIKKTASLKDRKGRDTHKLFLVEGWRSIETFLAVGWQPERIYVTRDMYSFLTFLHNHQLPIVLTTSAVIAKISSTKTPSGIIATFPLPPKEIPLSLQPGLVLADISDAGNMGTLIRTAAAFGQSSLILIEGCDPWNPKVVQSTAGALALVKIIHLQWQELVSLKGNLILAALVASHGTSPQSIDLCNALLVVGNEAHGIPKEWLNTCDAHITLPMPGRTESLNAAVAGAIALYIRYQTCLLHR